jgi:hypothetical protein
MSTRIAEEHGSEMSYAEAEEEIRQFECTPSRPVTDKIITAYRLRAVHALEQQELGLANTRTLLSSELYMETIAALIFLWIGQCRPQHSACSYATSHQRRLRDMQLTCGLAAHLGLPYQVVSHDNEHTFIELPNESKIFFRVES